MTIETKRDLFETFADECAGYEDELYKQYLRQYDNALPDDLPVIPKAVGEYIKDNEDLDLLVALTFANKGYKHSELWIAMHQNVFSLAWVLGVWRVEETGEVVKL